MARLKLQAISEQFQAFRTPIPHNSLLPRKKKRAWRYNQQSPISKHKYVWYFTSTPHNFMVFCSCNTSKWVSFSLHRNTDFLSINAAIVSEFWDNCHLNLQTQKCKKMTNSSFCAELKTSKNCSTYFRIQITQKHIPKIYEWCSVFSGSKKIFFFIFHLKYIRLQDDLNDLQQVSWCITLLISCLKSLREKTMRFQDNDYVYIFRTCTEI